MKTREFLQLESPEAMSSAIAKMKNKEIEKHARKLAKMAGLDYEEALLEGLSIVVDADDADDPSQQIYHRYTELCQPATIPPELEASLT